MAASKSKVIAVRRGSVEVRIAPTQRAFTISWYEGGRKRVRRADLEEAKLYAEEVATRIHNGQAGADLLTGDHRMSYLQAVEALSPTGVPLNEAVSSFVAAHRLLGTRATLQDAVRFFLSHSQEISVRKLTKDAYAEFIENKTIRTSKRNVETTRLHVGRFAEYFKALFLDEISHQQIDSYLRDVRQHRGRYFNNARTSLITFFRWARKAKYLGNFQTEADKIEKAQEVVEAVKIFTPSEFAKILSQVRSDLIPYLVLLC